MPFIPNSNNQHVFGWTPVNLPRPASNDDLASYSSQTPNWSEDYIFSDPDLARGETMLWLAERYPNNKIAERYNARPNKSPISVSTVATRIHRALQAKAVTQGISYERMRALFDECRKSNGTVNKMKKGSKDFLQGLKDEAAKADAVKDANHDVEEEMESGEEAPVSSDEIRATFEDVVAWKNTDEPDNSKLLHDDDTAEKEMTDPQQQTMDLELAIARFRSWDEQGNRNDLPF